MKTIVRNSIHNQGISHDLIIYEHNGKKIKFTYRSNNGSETCTSELFDGEKFNHLFSMWDTGEVPNNSSYVWDEIRRKKRANELFEKLQSLCKKLL